MILPTEFPRAEMVLGFLGKNRGQKIYNAMIVPIISRKTTRIFSKESRDIFFLIANPHSVQYLLFGFRFAPQLLQ